MEKKAPRMRLRDVLGSLLILLASFCATAGTMVFLIMIAFGSMARAADRTAWNVGLQLWLGGWVCLLAAGFFLTYAGGQKLAGTPGKSLAISAVLLFFGLPTVIYAWGLLPH
jgi:hypothetical protein